MKDNPSCFSDGSGGSIVLVNSTSGYFGATGVSGYISSKHGVTGLLRSSQLWADKYKVRVNAVAPFVTPGGALADGFAKQWQAQGLPSNSPELVANVVATLAMDSSTKGECYLVSPLLKLLWPMLRPA